jgi:hypothetical protein
VRTATERSAGPTARRSQSCFSYWFVAKKYAVSIAIVPMTNPRLSSSSSRSAADSNVPHGAHA